MSCAINEIYEHDIVEDENDKKKLIYKIEGGYAFGIPILVERAELYDYFITDIVPAKFKVIGNKFDNPNLI